MSTKGVYTALSGAMAQSLKMDTIANNIANSSTNGFKRDQQVFQEYLTNREKDPTVVNSPRIPASIDSFYDHQGQDKSFVDLKGTYTDHTQGGLRSTGANLDVAIDGDGFFEVFTPKGAQYTRLGSFTLDGNGQLVTKDGYPVMKEGEGDPAERVIKLQGGKVEIQNNGDITENGNLVGRLSVVKINDKNTLDKVGNLRFSFKSNARPEVMSVPNPKLQQGFLESSNVNIVREMTDMIGTTRVFETTQKAISAYDQMADKLVNVVPKTNG